MFIKEFGKIQYPLYDKEDTLSAFSKVGSSTLTEDEVVADDLRLMEERGKGKESKENEDEVDDDNTDDDLIVDNDLLEEEDKDKKGKKGKTEEELEEEDDTVKLEADEDYRNVDFKKLKEKFPELAKTPEFKALRDAYFREAKLNSVFNDLDEAKEAAENNATFIKINDEILNKGSVDGLLGSIKEANPEALKKVSLSILDSIAKLDSNLYAEVISPVVRKLARNIYNEGKKQLSRNKDSEDAKALMGTARNIMQWAFDDPDLVDKEEPTVKAASTDEKTDKEKELEEREQKIAARDYGVALNTCSTNLDRHLTKVISEGLDPKEELTEFVRDQIVEKIKKEIEGQVSSDKSHLKKMQGLWSIAQKNGYDKNSLSRIISAYLERAKPIIPRLRNTYKSRALGRRVKEEEQQENIKIVKGGRSGNPPQRDGKIRLGSVDSKKIDYRNTSDEDLMSGKVKLRS